MSETSISAANKPKKQRPLSPHLQVYKKQLTSGLSILHRISGVFLSLGLILFAWWTVALAGDADDYANVQAFLYSLWGKIVLFGATIALFFHTATGVRHLFWDAGYGFSIEATYRSGYAVIGFTILATLLVWGIGLEILP